MLFFFFKQKTAYEMRISDWSSDVCSSDLRNASIRYGWKSCCRLRSSSSHSDVFAFHAPAAQPLREGDDQERHHQNTCAEREHAGQSIGKAQLAVDRKSTRLNSSH